MYNGDLDKEVFIWKVGFKGEELVNVFDSYVFVVYFFKIIDNIIFEEIFRRFVFGLEIIRIMLNMGILFLLFDGSWSVFIIVYMVNKYINSFDDWNYVRFIEFKVNDLYVVVLFMLELYYEVWWRIFNNGIVILISGDKIECFFLGDVCGF